MRRLGFRQVGGSFVSRRGPVQHRFHLKRLRARSEPQLLLNLVVAIENPFDPERANAANWFANAFLEPEGISHRIRMHWTAEEAAGAQPCFEQWAPSFFIRFTDIGSLIDLVRAANEQKKTVDAFLAGPPSAFPADDEAASEFVTHLSRLCRERSQGLAPRSSATSAHARLHRAGCSCHRRPMPTRSLLQCGLHTANGAAIITRS